VLGEIEERAPIELCGDGDLDGRLCAALRALTSDMPWPAARASIEEAARAVGETLPVEPDPEVAARLSFVERERDRIVHELRARAPERSAGDRREKQRAERREDWMYAAKEARDRVRDAWRRWLK
jgi:hypothetical protein